MHGYLVPLGYLLEDKESMHTEHHITHTCMWRVVEDLFLPLLYVDEKGLDLCSEGVEAGSSGIQEVNIEPYVSTVALF